jgi:hypothetical protein
MDTLIISQEDVSKLLYPWIIHSAVDSSLFDASYKQKGGMEVYNDVITQEKPWNWVFIISHSFTQTLEQSRDLTESTSANFH